MSAPEIAASGGFNTGRLYTAKGQRIFYWQLANGWFVFRDLDRMVGGCWNRTEKLVPFPPSPGTIMQRYDGGAFQHYPPDECREADWMKLPVPDDFDFGEGLRI